MNDIAKALLWASAIIAAALISVANDLDSAATFGIIMGLSGAAIGVLNHGKAQRRRCLP